MNSLSFIVIIALVVGSLFLLLYYSQVTGVQIRNLDSPIHPKLSQIQALDKLYTDVKTAHPEVKDLYLYFSMYNYSFNDYKQHPELYRGYQYSYQNDVKQHPELLHLFTMYLHPNGTRFYVNSTTGNTGKYTEGGGALTGYCLKGDYCNSNLYRAFANRLVYGVDYETMPFVGTNPLWVDADSGEILWEFTPYLKQLNFDNQTVSQMLNPPKSSTINIQSDFPDKSANPHFVLQMTVVFNKVNNKVVWNNQDTVAHTVTSDNGYSNPYTGKFDSGIIQAGQSYQYVFISLGDYHYHCQIHPFMKGMISVTENFS